MYRMLPPLHASKVPARVRVPEGLIHVNRTRVSDSDTHASLTLERAHYIGDT